MDCGFVIEEVGEKLYIDENEKNVLLSQLLEQGFMVKVKLTGSKPTYGLTWYKKFEW